MQNLALFIPEHWFLIFAFTIVLLLFIGNELIGRLAAAKALSPEQLVLALNRNEAVPVDLRDSASFKKGHIIGAINVPHDTLAQADQKLERFKDRLLILYCSQGMISSKNTKLLLKKGFNVALLKGGVTAWKSANLPLTQ